MGGQPKLIDFFKDLQCAQPTSLRLIQATCHNAPEDGAS
jgi:hypothetical protein